MYVTCPYSKRIYMVIMQLVKQGSKEELSKISVSLDVVYTYVRYYLYV